MKKIDLACIIDDDPIFIYGTKRIMEMTAFCNQTLVYKNGFEAIENLRPLILSGKNLPEVILLDLNMPVMDGWQFLDEYIKIPSTKKITIFIVTSSIDPNDLRRVKDYQEVCSSIIKPLTKDQLSIMLNEHAISQN